MNNFSTKIALILLIAVLISACDAVKKVPANQHLLTKNKLEVDGKNVKDEAITTRILQQPNSGIFGFQLRLHMYNLAKTNTDSIFRAKYTKDPEKYYRKSKWLSKKQVDRLGKSFWYSGWHKFLIKTGEAPVIIDTLKTNRSIRSLKAYYFDEGFFDANARYKINYSENEVVSYTYMAALPKQENKYWLNVRNNGQENVNVKIFAQDGSLLFEQSVVVDGAYNTVFNLNKVKANQGITFEVTNGSGKVYTSTFN